MKTSNRLLLLLLIAILTSVVSVSFYLEPYFMPPPVKPEVVNIKKGYHNWTRDTLKGAYHYVWTNFPEVELDPSQAGQVHKVAYENASEHVHLEIRNDTLFVLQNPVPDYANLVNLNFDLRDTAVQIIVGAKHLRGIEAVDRGRITHFRGTKDKLRGSPDAFLPENWDVSPLKCNVLDINLKRGGIAVLKVDANTVRAVLSETTYFHTYTFLKLRGNQGSLYLTHRDGRVDVRTHHAQTDSVFVDSQASLVGQQSLIRVYADKYLNAKISGRANVIYLGNPTIKKKEFHSGRLIDGNFYK